MSLIVGAKVAAKIISECTTELEQTINDQQTKPKLSIIQIGKQDEWNNYLANEVQNWSEDRIEAFFHILDGKASMNEIKETIDQYNDDESTDAIFVQLPQMTRSNRERIEIFDKICTKKDVAALTSSNRGRLMCEDICSNEMACLPQCCLEIVSTATGNSSYACGKRVVIVCSRTELSLPIAALFMRQYANVIICDLQTPNLKKQCQLADILIVQIDMPKHIRGEWLKPGALVIDFGIHVLQRAIGGSTTCGDVHYGSACEVAAFLTAVPDGIASVFAAMLIKNTIHQALRRAFLRNAPGHWNVQYNIPTIWYPVPDDLEISQSQKPQPIALLARQIGLLPHEFELFGRTKAKVSTKVLHRLAKRKNGKYIVVVDATCKPFRSGESSTALGLAQALGAFERSNTIACLKQPSSDTVFGLHGEPLINNGGYAQVVPIEEFKLHLTGDQHAIAAANNLLSAAIDARVHHESTQSDEQLFDKLVPEDSNGVRRATSAQRRRLMRLDINVDDDLNELTIDEKRRFARLDIDPATITWTRVLEINDRFSRGVDRGCDMVEDRPVHNDAPQFDSVDASELMAILALSSSLSDLYERLASIVVANDKAGRPVTADDIGIVGALAAMLFEAFKPTLMQTVEGALTLIHAAPSASVTHGQSSIIADKLALKLVGKDGFVVTEASASAEVGLEKFVNIKCRYSSLSLDAAVIVVTVDALKMAHGFEAFAGQASTVEKSREISKDLESGCESSLRDQVNIVRKFGVPAVVCINHCEGDTQRECDLIIRKSIAFGASAAVVSYHWSRGAEGTRQLAKAVVDACKKPSVFSFSYNLYQPLRHKIQKIAEAMYGVSGIDLAPLALQKLKMLELQSFDHLPVCIVKGHCHLLVREGSKRISASKDSLLMVSDFRMMVGAGIICAVCGSMEKMPGLTIRPPFMDIDVDPETGLVVGQL